MPRSHGVVRLSPAIAGESGPRGGIAGTGAPARRRISGLQLLQPGLQILGAPEIKQGQGQLFQLGQAEGFDPSGGGGVNGPATALQLAQGQSAGLALAAFLLAQFPALLPSQLDALLPPFRKDLLEGAGANHQGYPGQRKTRQPSIPVASRSHKL